MFRPYHLLALFIIISFYLTSCILSCRMESDGDNKFPKKISILSTPSNVATLGIFDPSLEYEPGSGKIWMSYSAIDPSPSWEGVTDRVVSTRLASSGDQGDSWRYYDSINDILEIPNGTYNNEVSSIVYDSRDVAKPWKLVWFKYFVESDNTRRYDYSWIGVKSAATPQGLTTAVEERLFTGSLYADTPSVIRLDLLHADLNKYIAFTEPGLIATSTALYMSLGGLYSSGEKQDIILLKFTGDSSNITVVGNWEYMGILLNSDNASTHGTYTSYSGSELVSKGSDFYLLVTPVSNDPFHAHYNGCLIYSISDIDIPSVVYESKLIIPGFDRDVFFGACDYNSHASRSGIMYIKPDLDFSTPSNSLFNIYSSGENLD